jgi:hypothetical protein
MVRVEDAVEQQVTAFVGAQRRRPTEQETAQCGSALLTRRRRLGSGLRSGS